MTASCLAAAIALAALPALAQAPEDGPAVRLSLDDAVQLAIGESPRAIQAEAGYDMAAARLTQSRSAWQPQVELTQSWTRGDHPVFVFGSLLEQGRFGPENFEPVFLNDPPSLDHARLSLDLRMPIFDQLRRISGVERARSARESAAEDLDLARQTLRLETIRAYSAVLVARRALEVAHEAVAAGEADVAAIRDRFETGLLVESDLLAAEVQLAELRQQEISARGATEVTVESLRALLGVPMETTIELGASLPEPTIDDAAFPPTAVDEHPRVRSAKARLAAAAASTRQARAAYLPRLDGFASWSRNGSEIGENLSEDHLYGLRLSIPLSSPGREGSAAEALAAQRAAEASLSQTRSDVRLEIVSARNDLDAARQRLEVAAGATSQAREAARIIRDRYEEGLVTISEHLRARTAVTRAELNLLSSQHDLTLAAARLLWAAGRLHDVQTIF